jgi:hypothetical protein
MSGFRRPSCLNIMKQLATLLLTVCCLAGFAQQKTDGWLLEKMPADLETEYALSALPQHLRERATVYLLDPKKGYYLARKGTNGFSAIVNRTQFDWIDFVPDMYEAISYDSAGSEVYLKTFFDVASMRATGKYTPLQIKDTMVQRIENGIYKPVTRVGISYMLSPIQRVHSDGSGMINMTMPHYMFFAPCVDNKDIGGGWVPGGHQPFVVNSGPALVKAYTLDKAHSIFNYIIIAAGETEKAKIIEENKILLERLAAYKSYFKMSTGSGMEHGH